MTTIQHTYLQEDELVRRAIAALIRALGPVEATRFLTQPRSQPLDSIQRHREWQETLDPTQFLDQVFG
ncbi:MAG: hypothetical protein K8R89_09325 [Anaerolineae bacterium]|nr:hypothetical protein [Anaerolineae bacterium]